MKKMILSISILISTLFGVFLAMAHLEQFNFYVSMRTHQEEVSELSGGFISKTGVDYEKNYLSYEKASKELDDLIKDEPQYIQKIILINIIFIVFLYFLTLKENKIEQISEIKRELLFTGLFCLILALHGLVFLVLFLPIICMCLWIRGGICSYKNWTYFYPINMIYVSLMVESLVIFIPIIRYGA